MPFKMKMITVIVLFVLITASCSSNPKELKPGQMKHLPFTNNLAVGTDSSIVIVNRETGAILTNIPR